MMKNLVALILFISHVKCQFEGIRPKPEKCYGTTELLNRQCCIFPPFFKREIAKMCGARFAVMQILNTSNVTLLRREANDPCEHWKCMLEKYDLLNAEETDRDRQREETVDDMKYFTHLDKWVHLNPEFSKVMINAKNHCKQLYRLFLPLKTCEFQYLQSCIRNYINVSCPKMIPSQDCNELKSFYEECREYYISK